MALSSSGILEIAATGSDGNSGSDSNAGMYNPTNTNFLTNITISSANTSSPVVTWTGAQTGDVGHWFFLKTGINGTAGWWKIASVVVGTSITLSAAIGAGVLYATGGPYGLNTVAGCGTASSLTNQTGGIDYSQGGTPIVSVTNAVTNGTTTITSASGLFTTMMPGDHVAVSGGTGSITAAIYEVVSVTNSTTIVVDRSTGLTTGTGATLKLGGCLATKGQAGANHVGGSTIYWKSGSYTMTSATANISGGRITLVNAQNTALIGYNSLRADNPTGSGRPTETASGISSFTMAVGNGSTTVVRGIIFNCASLTSSIGCAGTNGQYVSVQNATGGAFTVGGGAGNYLWCDATGCSTTAAFGGTMAVSYCVAWSNSISGFSFSSGSAFSNCLSVNNTGATTQGFLGSGSTYGILSNCTAYGNEQYGFSLSGTSAMLVNCLSYGNTTNDYHGSSAFLWNCAGGSFGNLQLFNMTNCTTLTANPFNNAASGDFSLNSTTGGGAACQGISQSFPGVSTTGYLYIGAVPPKGGSSAGYVLGC